MIHRNIPMETGDKVYPSDWNSYSKKALSLTPKAKERQRRYHRTKANQVYKNWCINKTSILMAYASINSAITLAQRECMRLHGYRPTRRVIDLMAVILEYSAGIPSGAFNARSLYEYILSSAPSFHELNLPRLRSRLRTLVRNSYINPLGNHQYMPTRRAKVFSDMVQKHWRQIEGIK